MPTYQAMARKQTRNKIIKLLSAQPLTFKELVEKSERSRAVVNRHLNDLQTEGLIKKEYKDGKILNVLQLTELDMVSWFLSQLENIGVPQEVLEKGKISLNGHVLVFSLVIYVNIWTNILKISDRARQKALKVEHKILARGRDFTAVPSKIKTLDISVYPKNETEAKLQELLKGVLAELNPYSFNVALTAYRCEKLFHETEAASVKKETWKCFFGKMPQDLKERFDKTLEWWYSEVSEYVPSSRLLQALTVTYFNRLWKM